MEKHENLSYDGISLLQIRMSLPTHTEFEAINELYAQTFEACYAFCHEHLLAYAKECYDNDPDPRRRVRFSPFRYRLHGEIAYQSDALVSIRVEASLSRNGNVLQNFSDAHNFSLPEGLLLAPHDALTIYAGERVPKKHCKKIDSLLLTDREALVKREGAWQVWSVTNEPKPTKKETV